MTEYIETKTILSKLKDAPDPYFGITYNMNLYRGCQHQCIYCDSRSKVYGIEDFATIQIKANALQLLEKALNKRSKSKGTIGTGAMNDPYMPIDKRTTLTRRALELISKYRYPVHAMTKSNLVTRDSDVFQEITRVYATVSFTITTTDDSLSQILEPGATVTSKRLDAMTQLVKKGIYCGIVLTPVLPFITDKERNITEIVYRAKDAGASYILGWMGMTQREGQREYYYNKLDQHFPGLRKKYIQRFGNAYNCTPVNVVKLNQAFKEACTKVDLPMSMKFYSAETPLQLSLFKHKSDF